MRYAEKSTDNLCDECLIREEIPKCIPDNVVFGNGFGSDNIIECENAK